MVDIALVRYHRLMLYGEFVQFQIDSVFPNLLFLDMMRIKSGCFKLMMCSP